MVAYGFFSTGCRSIALVSLHQVDWKGVKIGAQVSSDTEPRSSFVVSGLGRFVEDGRGETGRKKKRAKKQTNSTWWLCLCISSELKLTKFDARALNKHH